MTGERNGAATVCGVCQAATDAFICRGCTTRLERDVADLSWLLAELTVTETRQGRTYRASGRAERDAEAATDPEGHVRADLRSRDGRIALRATALPFDEAASVLRDEAWSTVTAWCRHLAESRGVDTPLNATALVWLAGHVESIRWDEAAAEMVDEIGDVHRRLTRAIDRSADRIYIGPCGGDVEAIVLDETDGLITSRVEHSICERDVYRETSGGTARCDGYRQDGRGCGARHDLAERQSWFRASIEDMLAPIVEWQAALPEMFPNRYLWPTRWTWARWAENPPHALEAHSVDGQGRPLFRGGDVLAQVESEQGRIKRKREADDRAREQRAS